jgi:transcription factor SPT20
VGGPRATHCSPAMAPVVTAIPPPQPAAAPKSKRPIPPGIQTNGVVSTSKSSPSPSMSAKRTPSAIHPPLNPPAVNGSSTRPANRQRREQSAQLLGRGQRSAGLRSASMAPDAAAASSIEPLPYGKHRITWHIEAHFNLGCIYPAASPLLTCTRQW